MSTFIRHRLNSPDDLSRIDPTEGVEIDLRSRVDSPGSLHLSHDPWAAGPDFDIWVEAFVARKIQGPIVLNTKEDGLEEAVIARLERAGLDNYFFLDTTVPTLVKWLKRGRGAHFSARISRHEPPSTLAALRMKGVAPPAWLWIDCFDGEPLGTDVVAPLAEDFRLCLVAPELQGKPASDAAKFQPLRPFVEAICTKQPTAWQ